MAKKTQAPVGPTQQAVINRINDLCKINGLNPSRLATKCGLPRATVRDILNGESKTMKFITLKMICDGLDMTLPDFFNTSEFRKLEQEIK